MGPITTYELSHDDFQATRERTLFRVECKRVDVIKAGTFGSNL